MKTTRRCSGLSTSVRRNLLRDMSQAWQVIARQVRDASSNIRLRGGQLLLPKEIKRVESKAVHR